MLDLKWIRENPDAARRGLKAKNVNVDLDDLLELDRQRREKIRAVEDLKAERNKASDEVARLKKAGEPAEAILASLKASSQKIKECDADVGRVSENINALMLSIPNMPHKDVPVAPGDKGNKVIRSWGEAVETDFSGKDHLELAESLGWLSMKRGSRITGSGFAVYQGEGARLQRALIDFMLDMHTGRHGYTEIWPPALVNRKAMTGTGQLPKMEEDMYRLAEEDYFLIPTGEVPVTNLLAGEILEDDELPCKYTAYTPCFRREAGSYGKETRGLSRLHQFDKVEMVNFVRPEDGLSTLDALVGEAEAVLQALGLAYRVVLLGSGDLSFAAAKCYDLEIWAPVSKTWYEVSSCSLFGDFQARRAGIRYRPKDSKKPEFVHTLNGSGLALARLVLCLLEACQTRDGKVEWPEALRPYMQGR